MAGSFAEGKDKEKCPLSLRQERGGSGRESSLACCDKDLTEIEKKTEISKEGTHMKEKETGDGIRLRRVASLGPRKPIRSLLSFFGKKR